MSARLLGEHFGPDGRPKRAYDTWVMASAFAAEYARLALDRRSLELGEKENGECVFLLGNECVIHPVKPAQCRAFPDGWRYPGAEEICPACRPGPQKPV